MFVCPFPIRILPELSEARKKMVLIFFFNNNPSLSFILFYLFFSQVVLWPEGEIETG